MDYKDLQNIAFAYQEHNEKNNNSVRELLKTNSDEGVIKLAKQMLPHSDISIHFSLKGADIEKVGEILLDYLHSIMHKVDGTTSINHCFLSRAEVEEKGFDTTVVEFFEGFEEGMNVKSHTRGMVYVDAARADMFTELKNSFNPLCIFIGDIVEGVEIEYNTAKALGLQIVEL